MLASKFFDDVYYNNAYYARVGGISNGEVNALEMEMLRMISFSLLCSRSSMRGTAPPSTPTYSRPVVPPHR